MSTQLTRNDIKFEYSNAHKTITLNSGSSDVSTISFLSGSNNITSPTVFSSYYVSIDHFYYTTGSSVYYQYSDIGDNPQYKNKFNTTGLVINISSDRYGEKIKPGTFSYWDNGNSSPMIIRDDGYGNLYPTNETGNLILSQSADSSISSSDNYVGNIFYDHGIAVITETGSYKSGKKYTDFGTNYSMSFDSTVEINTMEYLCKLLPHEYNWSTNPTILSASDAISTSSFYINNDMTRPEASASQKQINLSKHVRHFNSMDYVTYHPISHEETKSFWRINDPIIHPRYLTREFTPYITKLQFMNEDDEVVMVASFEHPLQKRKDETMTIKVQMDF